MSLLNEALRKKSRERCGRTPVTLAFTDRTPNRAGRSIRIASIILVAAGIATGGWLWLTQEIFTPAQLTNLQAEPAVKEREATVPGPAQEAPSLPMVIQQAAAPAPGTDLVEAEKRLAASTPHKRSFSNKASTPSRALLAAASTTNTPQNEVTSPAQSRTGAVTTPRGSRTEAVGPYWEKALSYHRERDFQKAISMYSEVLQRDPGHVEALLNLAAVYIELQAFSRAHPLLAQLKTISPENPRVWINLATAELGLGRPAEALADLQHAEQTGGDSFDIHLHRGAALSRLGRAGEALDSYRQAELIRPREPSLIFNMAVAHDREARFSEALRYYQAFLGLAGTIPSHQKKGVEERISVLRAYLAGNSTGEKS